VTDANLVLGYLDPARFLGGARRLDEAAAQAALGRLAAALGVSVEHAAAGVHRLVNLRMADGLQSVTVRRGVDPRGLTLLAFGGAAGLHAAGVARVLGMRRAAVPLFAAGLSAWGMLNTPLRHETVQAVADPAGVPDDAALAAMFDAVEQAARARLTGWASGEVAVSRAATMRYGEQIFDIPVPLAGLDWTAPGLAARVGEKFHARHRALFTYALPNDPVTLTSARVAATLTLPPSAGPGAAAAPSASTQTRRIWLDAGWVAAPLHDLGRLGADQAVAGPAVLESDTTTVLLLPGDTARMDARGWLDIAVGLTPSPAGT
jgi:N-methylhydantoinase A